MWLENNVDTHLNVLDGTGMHFVAIALVRTMLTCEQHIRTFRFILCIGSREMEKKGESTLHQVKR